MNLFAQCILEWLGGEWFALKLVRVIRCVTAAVLCVLESAERRIGGVVLVRV